MAGLSWSLQAGSRVAGPRSLWGPGAEAVEAPRGMALVLCTGKGQTCCPLGKGVCKRHWSCEMRALGRLVPLMLLGGHAVHRAGGPRCGRVSASGPQTVAWEAPLA